ncbi:MAG TPA: hypothetical protein VES65_05530 [Solirubrobacteraceae bacterium]|nr:hypothetical protein [Solirubrobacteraceae bacterium]
MRIPEADGVFRRDGVTRVALAGALGEFADKTTYPDDYVDTWVQLAGANAGAIGLTAQVKP